MHIFSPLDSDIYITLKHFETLAGSKRGFKNRIIAISVLASYEEAAVFVPYGFSSFPIQMA